MLLATRVSANTNGVSGLFPANSNVLETNVEYSKIRYAWVTSIEVTLSRTEQ